MLPQLENEWQSVLGNEFDQLYMRDLERFLKKEYEESIVYPDSPLIFSAFTNTPFSQVKVVILGQDPYHQPGQAHGLSFSVLRGVCIPPSLQNIYKELHRDVPQFSIPSHGELLGWAKQGVLLLNATLTVRANSAGSHQQKGWEKFTDQVIRTLSDQRESLVFMLWGKYAQNKAKLIDEKKHCLLFAPHPSPLSAYRGFLGCGHFTKANAYLMQQGLTPIDWQV